MHNLVSYSDFSLGLVRDLEILASDNDCVLWIRNLEYNQQLYLSNSYTRLFGRECLSVYKDPASWSEPLDTEDKDSFLNELTLKRTILSPDYTAIYSIKHPNGEQRWFQDRSVQLPINAHEIKIIVGCSLYVHSKEQLDYEQHQISEKLDVIIAQYAKMITTTYTTDKVSNTVNNHSLLKKLSKREKEIFILFIQGKTIAEVAHLVHLSPRTIEGYLINLKSKLQCESKSELIMKAIENGWMSINL